MGVGDSLKLVLIFQSLNFYRRISDVGSRRCYAFCFVGQGKKISTNESRQSQSAFGCLEGDQISFEWD